MVLKHHDAVRPFSWSRPDQRDDLIERIELGELVPRGIDRDVKRILQKRNQLEHAERIDDAAREQRRISGVNAVRAHAGSKSSADEPFNVLLHGRLPGRHGDGTLARSPPRSAPNRTDRRNRETSRHIPVRAPGFIRNAAKRLGPPAIRSASSNRHRRGNAFELIQTTMVARVESLRPAAGDK